jgi:hypothetical protein
VASIPSDARQLLNGLIGRTIVTVTGRTNTVLEVRDTEVVVATGRSPGGAAVPIAWVQDALDRLVDDSVIEISVDSVGHRSAFVGAVLLTLPGARATRTTPPCIRLNDDAGENYRRRAAGDLNVWWHGDPSERYWLEITDRPDIGVDLHAPQRDAGGNPTPGYSLMWWVTPGDTVFHYDRKQRAITAWSRAVGSVAEAPVIWLSHRGATRRRIGAAQAQPGWWLDLEGPYPLAHPLTLTDMRARGAEIRLVLDDLRARHAGALYFPFSFYGGNQLRPMQPYLNKLPAALVDSLPELAEGAGLPTAASPLVGADSGSALLGVEYRSADVSSLPDARDPFTVDPAIVERGLRGHADTQNALAGVLVAAGLAPRSPRADEPYFDLAWERDGIVYVAEVKSITPQNEERQLRLGLGQVLRYRNLLGQKGYSVEAVLVAEHTPRDPSWKALCEQLGVLLIAPPRFDAVLPTAIHGFHQTRSAAEVFAELETQATEQ